MATHSSILAWKIQWTEETGGLQFMGSQRVRHDLATKQQQTWKLFSFLFTFICFRIFHNINFNRNFLKKECFNVKALQVVISLEY